MIVSMDGFQKFNLENAEKESTAGEPVTTVPTTKRPMKRSMSPKKRKILFTVGGVVAVLILFFVFGILIPGISLAAQAKKAYAQAKLVLADAKAQNLQLASDDLTKAREEIVKTQDDLKRMGYLAFIPVANFYYSDATHLGNAALYSLDGGRVFIDAIKPYEDVLGLKGAGTYTGGTAQQRIQTAVQAFSKVTPELDKIAASLDKVRTELDQVDPNHYPSFLGGDKIKTNLANAKTISDQAYAFVHQATPLVKVLPQLLGEPTEQKYLLLFQNNAELRPTGGFITAYAVMRFEHGLPHPDSSGDIYTLDATVPNKPAAPQILQQYLPAVPQLNLRDTNLSPDFIVSMDAFNKLYKTAGGYKPVSGIIAIDTYPLVHAIDILGGSIDVDGTTFSSKIDARCDCPNVIYQLEVAADQPVNYVKTDRKGIIGDLMIAIMNKALLAKPKLYWGPLLQAMITDAAQKHILFDIYNTDAQKGLEALNVAGRILPFDGDYLAINEANFGGAKSNLFVNEEVTQNYQFNSDGTIEKTITVNYKNPFPPSDCNLERGGLCLNAILRDFIRVYVPKGSQLVSSKGSEVKVTTSEDLGKTVFSGFLTVRPKGAATYTLTYRLPFKLDKSSILPAMYQKQPGTNAFPYTIQVNGKTVQQFPLIEDKTIKINP